MIALLAALVVGTSAAPAPSGADAVLAFADHLLDRGEPYRAAGEYERYLFLCPDCGRAPYAQLRIADAHRRGGKMLDAAARYRALAEKWAGTAEALEALRAAGETLEEAKQPALASDAYRDYARAHAAEKDAAELWTRSVRTALRAHDEARVRSALAVEGPAKDAVDGAALLRALDSTDPRRRSPAVAGVLSAIVPGAGHVYAGRWREGLNSFVINGLFIGATWVAIDHEQYAVAAVLGGMELFWYGGNVVGAANATWRFNARAEDDYYRSLERRWVVTPAVSFRF